MIWNKLTQRDKYKYLGIVTINFWRKFQVTLSHYVFVKNIHNDITYKSPGPEDQFKVNQELLELNDARKEKYHTIAAKTL